jgi:SAM-dependent methyltransferase
MEHYYRNIQGWFDYEWVYDTAIQRAEHNAHFVELGSWRGKSTCYLGVSIVNSFKKIKVDAVDTWRGSLAEDVHQTDPAVINDTLYDEFLQNIKPIQHIINPVRLSSMDAVKTYAENSLDFVLIDGSHEYEDVVDDITEWLKRVKPGGTLAGDDYKWEGVKRAVNELLPSAELANGHWIYKKPTL